MEMSEINSISELIKQIVSAATPAARQTYEAGILALRIDAAQTLVLSAVFFAISIFILRRVFSDVRAAKTKSELPENRERRFENGISDHLPLNGGIHGFAAVAGVLIAVAASLNIFDVWMWVKLIAPNLWLAHKAIEKIIN